MYTNINIGACGRRAPDLFPPVLGRKRALT